MLTYNVSMTLSIRPYQATDVDAVYQLWQEALGTSWPITPDFLALLLSDYGHANVDEHLVAEQDGQLIGFIAMRTDSPTEGSIPLVMVSPTKQRQGIGRRLQAVAVERFHQKDIDIISLGHGPFWPGVPHECPGAVEFFKACGWKLLDTNYDLLQDLTAYQTPSGVLERIAPLHIDFRLASPTDVVTIVDFEQRVFPFWSQFFKGTADAGKYTDILAAWDGQTVVGTLLLEAAPAHWHLLLGDDMGNIGCVGVDEHCQGQGIGLALVATASAILQKRGVRQCVIGWTDLLNFYGKLGYTIWRTYAMTDEP
jgi:ribosomal protein S18 acetylase RimI-like enzyme